jgi:hypothetical protein
MRRWIRTVRARNAVLGVASLIFLSSCISGSHASPSTSQEGCPTRISRSTLLIGGSDALNASLYEEQACSGKVRLVVASSHRFSSVASTIGHAVVAEASETTDHVRLLQGSTLGPLPDGSSPAGVTPDVAPSGDIAYVTLGTTGEKAFWVVRVGAGGGREVVYSSTSPLTFPRFGPQGQIVVLEQPLKPGTLDPQSIANLTVITSRGVVRFPVALPSIDGLTWDWKRNLAIVSSPTHVGLVVSLATGRVVRTVPQGWRIQATDRRSGASLFVIGTRAAIVDVASPRWSPTFIPAPFPVYSAAWSPSS